MMSKVAHCGSPSWNGEYLRRSHSHRSYGDVYGVTVDPFVFENGESSTVVRVERTYSLEGTNGVGPDKVINEEWEVDTKPFFVPSGEEIGDPKNPLHPGTMVFFAVPKSVAEGAIEAAKEHAKAHHIAENAEDMLVCIERAKQQLERYSEARTKQEIESLITEAEKKRTEATATIEAWEQWATAHRSK